MTETDSLQAIFERLIAGGGTEADAQILRNVLQTQQIALATGNRAVAITGDANDAMIVTGDGNIVTVFRGPDANIIRELIQEIIESSRSHALLSYTEFRQRTEQVALIGQEGKVVGREQVLEQLRVHFATQTAQVIVLHGIGGVGKTRLMLALPDIIPEDTSLWYVRSESESIDHDLAALDRNRRHVIVVEDAHRFPLLRSLREVLVNPDLAGKVQLVLTTRTVFKDTVTAQLSVLPNNQLTSIGIEPLSNADVDLLLQNPPHSIADEPVRHQLIVLAEGNPLVAGISARLVTRGVPIVGLTRDEAFRQYLAEIIQELAGAGLGDRYLAYLEILAALGTVDLESQDLRQRVQQVVGISAVEEERMIKRLTDAGLVERYWKTVKIASEVLADHLLVQHFFSAKRQADFESMIIEPFFALRPKEILRNLAEAEVKGESAEAGTLLGEC